jgi:hypothetical protein
LPADAHSPRTAGRNPDVVSAHPTKSQPFVLARKGDAKARLRRRREAMVRMLREFIGSLDETKTPPIMAPGRSPAIEGLRIAWRGPFGPAPPSRVTIYPRKAAPSCWHAAQLFCRHCQALWSRRGRTETQPFSWGEPFFSLRLRRDRTGRDAAHHAARFSSLPPPAPASPA